MEVQSRSKIFEFAKVIGTVNEIPPKGRFHDSRIISSISSKRSEPSPSSSEGSEGSDTSSQENMSSEDVKSVKIWKSKKTMI
jgi:hypothetical protein